LEKYKGVHNLIIALTRLDDEVTLNIVGDGPFKDHLSKMVAALKLEKRVRFEQDLSRAVLLQKYADSDLFALLSEHESYGLCVAEALAARTPCIVANTSALSEWIDAQGCYGIDYPVKIDVFVNCVNKVLGTGVSNVNVALLDWDEIVKKLTRLYENVAK
jgi:glycosyltransferase involved in cell wall biosynthesis